MPLLDAYIPVGALGPEAEEELLGKLTNLLLEHEGVDPANDTGRQLAWLFVHRPEVYVAGSRPKSPRYRFICQVPEGQYNEERRAALTASITEAVIEAEAGKWPHPELRTVIFTVEVPEGWWSGGKVVLNLATIYELVWPLRPGMDGNPRDTAQQVLGERRKKQASELLAAAGFRPETEVPA